MTLFVTIVYLIITVVLILVVLLQAGRGGGLGTALGGGSSQSVFGGGGGADFLAKLTQGLAIGFMVCAVYLAYASTHSGSSRLQSLSQDNTLDEGLVDENEPLDYERLGSNPLPLPPADASPEDPPLPRASDVAPAEDEESPDVVEEESAPEGAAATDAREVADEADAPTEDAAPSDGDAPPTAAEAPSDGDAPPTAAAEAPSND